MFSTLDPNNALPALIRACQLIEELDAGDVVGGAIDIYPNPVEEKQILFDPERINAYLGTDIDEETQLSYFPALEIKYDPATKMLTIPTFRQDLLRGADIAEEVARFYGYDNIPSTLPDSEEMSGRLSHGFVVQNKIRETMRAYGYSEAMTFSFESPKVFDKLHLATDDPHRNVVTISNPLGEDYSIMRTSLINGMMTSLAINFNRRNKSAALYELSNIYLPKALPLTELPDERMTLCFGFYGEGDFFDLKGTMEEVLTHLGLRMPRDYVADASLTFLHPGRQAKVMVKGGREQIGYLGEVHPQVSKAYGMNGKVYIAQVDVQALYDYANFDKKYKEIPKYPAVTRDLSMVMDKEIPAGEIENVISKCGGKLLESYNLFDIYEGERIGENKKSLAYSMVFRANDRTLEDKDVNPIIDKIIAKLKEKNIELRS